jgi:hypothetical protein
LGTVYAKAGPAEAWSRETPHAEIGVDSDESPRRGATPTATAFGILSRVPGCVTVKIRTKIRERYGRRYAAEVSRVPRRIALS